MRCAQLWSCPDVKPPFRFAGLSIMLFQLCTPRPAKRRGLLQLRTPPHLWELQSNFFPTKYCPHNCAHPAGDTSAFQLCTFKLIWREGFTKNRIDGQNNRSDVRNAGENQTKTFVVVNAVFRKTNLSSAGCKTQNDKRWFIKLDRGGHQNATSLGSV